MFLKLASVPGLFISAALGFYGLASMSSSSEDGAGSSMSRPIRVVSDALRGVVSSEVPSENTAPLNSSRAWVDPSGLEDVEPLTRAARIEVDEQAACRAKLVWAIKFHVLYALEGNSWDRLDLIVGPPFELLSSQQKEDFIRAIDCIAQNGRSGQTRIRVLHWKSRDLIGEVVSGKLTMI